MPRQTKDEINQRRRVRFKNRSQQQKNARNEYERKRNARIREELNALTEKPYETLTKKEKEKIAKDKAKIEKKREQSKKTYKEKKQRLGIVQSENLSSDHTSLLNASMDHSLDVNNDEDNQSNSDNPTTQVWCRQLDVDPEKNFKELENNENSIDNNNIVNQPQYEEILKSFQNPQDYVEQSKPLQNPTLNVSDQVDPDVDEYFNAEYLNDNANPSSPKIAWCRQFSHPSSPSSDISPDNNNNNLTPSNGINAMVPGQKITEEDVDKFSNEQYFKAKPILKKATEKNSDLLYHSTSDREILPSQAIDDEQQINLSENRVLDDNLKREIATILNIPMKKNDYNDIFKIPPSIFGDILNNNNNTNVKKKKQKSNISTNSETNNAGRGKHRNQNWFQDQSKVITDNLQKQNNKNLSKEIDQFASDSASIENLSEADVLAWCRQFSHRSTLSNNVNPNNNNSDVTHRSVSYNNNQTRK